MAEHGEASLHTRAGAAATHPSMLERRRRPDPSTVTDAAALPRLHERADLLSELRQVVDGSWAHPIRPIVIDGPPGSGKTALFNACLAMADEHGQRVARARCDPSDQATELGVVRQLLESLTRVHQLDQRLTPGPADSDDWMIEICDALTQHLDAAHPSLLLVVDDAHLADSASLAFLHFLARRSDSSAVRMMLTTRTRRAGMSISGSDRLLADPEMRRFTLRPLGPSSIATMLSDRLAVDLDPGVVAAAHHMTGGNTFLIACMARAIDELDIPHEQLTAADIAGLISPAVAQSVFASLATAPAGAVALLEATAVLGHDADLRVAAALAGIDGDEAGRYADLLADLAILRPGRPLGYLHPFVRRSVYAELQPAKRAKAHAIAGQLLSALGRDVTETAAHLVEADATGDDWTASILIDAAHCHLAAGDVDRAAAMLQRADREAPTKLLHADVARLRAELEGRRGDPSAIEHLERAARLGLDRIRWTETVLDLLDQRWDRPMVRTLLAMIESVPDDQLTEQPDLRVRLRLARSVLDPHRAPPPRAEDALADTGPADSRARQLTAIRHATQMAVLHPDHSFRTMADELQARLTGDVIDGGGPVHTAVIAGALGVLVRAGLHAPADPLLQRARATALAERRFIDAAVYALALSESLALQGQFDAAERALDGLPADLGPLDACVRVKRAWIEALHRPEPDQPDGAIDHPTAEEFAALGNEYAMFYSFAIAELQLLRRDWEGALRSFDELGAASARLGISNPSFAPWRAGRCEALAALGRADETTVMAAENLQLARQFGAPVTVGWALVCSSFSTPAHQRVIALDEAVQLLRHSGAVILHIRALIALGLAHHHAGSAISARRELRRAGDLTSQIGVSSLIADVSRGLLATGARPRRLRTTGADSLTPAEHRVAVLAAGGATNAAIARELFVHVKTVESHLAKAYRKLGIALRGDLRSVLEHRGVTFDEQVG